jgi:hypothetical protein
MTEKMPKVLGPLNPQSNVVELTEVSHENAQTTVPPMGQPIDSWHIAVAGNIDVRQHHPFWYHAINCISDGELPIGLNSLFVLPAPIFSRSGVVLGIGAAQFSVGQFIIDVIPERWMIQTWVEANCDRMIEVASVVFGKLNELPVTGYGINRSMFLDLGTTPAKQFLADQLAGAKLALPKGKSEAYIRYVEYLGNKETQIAFSATPSRENLLNVDYNRHHPTTGFGGYFDLGSLLRENAKADWTSASAYGEELARLIAPGA